MYPSFILYSVALLWMAVWMIFGGGLLVSGILRAFTMYEFSMNGDFFIRCLSFIIVFFFGFSTTPAIVGFMYDEILAMKRYLKLSLVIIFLAPILFLVLISVNKGIPLTIDDINSHERRKAEKKNNCCYVALSQNDTRTYDYEIYADCWLVEKNISKQVNKCHEQNGNILCSTNDLNENQICETRSNTPPLFLMFLGVVGTFVVAIIIECCAYIEIQKINNQPLLPLHGCSTLH
ncbi:hypothetical protein QTN25_008596 [Entamoeba marina]